jgi:hypothetical protein
VDLDKRALILAQTLAFFGEFYQLIDRWSAWATQVVAAPDASGRARRVFTAVALDRVVRR